MTDPAEVVREGLAFAAQQNDNLIEQAQFARVIHGEVAPEVTLAQLISEAKDRLDPNEILVMWAEALWRQVESTDW